MAGFRTHITTSTVIGVGYGAVGYAYGLPPSTCLVAAGACSVSGMLPDLDSDSGVPVREMFTFMAAVLPALMIPRFQSMGFNNEQIAMTAGLVYIAVRFGVARLFRKYTVHRGMWHSIPAAAIVGLLAFWLVSGDDLFVRLFKTGGFVLGFMVHLVLDEWWSIETTRGRLRFKKSFGTALKFWNKRDMWSNISTYGKLVAISVVVVGDPYLMNQMGVECKHLPRNPREWLAHATEHGTELLQVLREGYHKTVTPDNAATASPAMETADGPAPVIDAPNSFRATPAVSELLPAPPMQPLPQPSAQTDPLPWPSSADQDSPPRWSPPYIQNEQPAAETARTPFYYPPESSRDRY